MSDESTRKRAMPPRKWGGEPPAAHPVPEVAMRDATEDEIPRAAKLMRKRAEAAGWTVGRVTFARGTVMHLTGKPGRVVDSIALRIHKDGVRAWAIWHGGNIYAAQIWEPGVNPWPRSVGAKEFAARVVAP